jgi:murein tripeptide amidase MpaA
LPFTTAEGRQSHALVIGTLRNCPQVGVLIISGAHAREVGGPDICINFAADLLEAYSGGSGLVYGGTSYTAAQIKAIVETVDLIVFPDINPDGRNFAQTTPNTMWRKNRNPVSSGGVASRIGVDVNRNYDFLWDFNTFFSPGAQAGGTLASNDPGNDLFHGRGPFSEAETKNVRWLFEQYPYISWFLDLHSYGGDILHSWGDDLNQTSTPGKNFTNPAWNGQRGVTGDAYSEYINACDLADIRSAGNAVKAAIAGVQGRSYAVDQAFLLPSWGSPYPTSGASDDWAFSRHYLNAAQPRVRSYCIEFNLVHTFFPSMAELDLIIRDIDAGLVRFCLLAVPRLSMPTWWCRLRRSFNDAIWHRVFPPELWGPYGPWGRVINAVERVLGPIIRPIVRAWRGR